MAHVRMVAALVLVGAVVLEKWPEHNLYTSSWYECGVSIP